MTKRIPVDYSSVPSVVYIEARLLAYSLAKNGHSVREVAHEMKCTLEEAQEWSAKPFNGAHVLKPHPTKFDHRQLPRELQQKIKTWAQTVIKDKVMTTEEVAGFLGIDLPCMYSWTRKKALLV